MRISDWSSDVCSSDLRPAFTLVKRCPNHQGSQSDTDDLTFRSVRRYIPNRTSPHSDSYGSPDERARIDVPLPARRNLPRDDGPRGHSCRYDQWSAAVRQDDLGQVARSEEHTSEIQTLMRI